MIIGCITAAALALDLARSSLKLSYLCTELSMQVVMQRISVLLIGSVLSDPSIHRDGSLLLLGKTRPIKSLL